MATPKERVYAVIAERSLRKVRDFSKENMPDADDLVDIAKSRTTQARNNKIDKKISSVSQKMKSEVVDAMDKGVDLMSRKSFLDSREMLIKKGINVSKSEMNALVDEFSSRFTREKFMGKTASQRAKGIADRVDKELKVGVRKMVRRGDKDMQAQKIIDTVQGKRRGYYVDGEKYKSFSAARSNERLVVSEVNRAQRKGMEFFAENIGVEYVQWITRRDNKVCRICWEIANARNIIGYEGSRPIMGIGIYRVGDVPHSHPYCRCRLEMVITEGAGLARISGGNVDALLNQYGGNGVTAKRSSDFLESYLGKKREMDLLSDLDPMEKYERKMKYKEALEDKSIEGLQVKDRLFFNNVKRGQTQAMLDMAKSLGLEMDAKLVSDIGVENAIRVAFRDMPFNKFHELKATMKDYIGNKLEESTAEIDARLKSARQAKLAAGEAIKRSDKAMYDNAVSYNIQRARKEAGQSFGYVDAMERMERFVLVRDNNLVIKFQNQARMNEFLKQYPNPNYEVHRTRGVVYVQSDQVPAFSRLAKEKSKEEQYILGLKRGEYNQGADRGYHPKGTKRDFRLSSDQEGVVKFMKHQEAVIVNAAPGTGKTAMGVAAVQELRAEGKITKKVLYVTKNKLTGQANEEFEKFVGNGKNGNAEKLEDRLALYADKTKDTNIVSHKGFMNDVLAGRIKVKDYDAIIVDEFQLLGQEGRAVLEKFKPKYRFAMSGTPVQNDVGELWPVIKWIDPKLFKFKEEYTGLFARAARESTFFQNAVYRDINDRLAMRMITRKQESLKPLTTINKEGVVRGKRLAAIRDLEDKYNNSSYYKGNPTGKKKIREKMQGILDGDIPEKQKFLQEIFNDHEGQKKIIFTKDVAEGNIVEKMLKQNGVDKDLIFRLDTRVKDLDEVEALKSRYRKPGKESVIIMDATMSAGHDLPQAKVVVHYSPPTSYATWMQRTARAWRKGNVETTAYNLRILNTLEDEWRGENLSRTKKIFTVYQDAESVDDTGVLGLLREERARQRRKP